MEQNQFFNFSKFNVLIETLIQQSRNELFFEGNVEEVSKTLVKEVSDRLNVDRTSIWLYGKENKSIICHQLYNKLTDSYENGLELFENDYPEYFDALKANPIIVADNAETHPATACFTETYLKPLGIKSILDVPIFYKKDILGVICIESCVERIWDRMEIDFAQLLTSLFSFSYSVKENSDKQRRLDEYSQFISKAALISITDKNGKITFVNDKFTKVSGWSLEEVLGKDHNIVNSGVHTKEFWSNMYKTVLSGEIWNEVVTNKTKNGELYYVDTYIRAMFDENGNLEGFSSIRQDVTNIVNTINELDKKNTYLEHSAKILRHDMHSGINTYIPRGITSLERRLTVDDIARLKIEAPLKMIKEGLKHTQKVYRGVYEFTNLVKKDVVLSKSMCSIKKILEDYLSSTAYKSQVILNENLPTIEVNESLFCTSIDNLIRNGLKYNDSSTKLVKIYSEDDFICVEDNGRGIDQKDFDELSKPYVRKEGQKETGSGLGLNICKAILTEHKFDITAEKLSTGTKLRIKIK